MARSASWRSLSFEEVPSALIKRQPDDSQLQLVLARRHADRGKLRLADKQPDAQAELEKTREIFRQLRATVPQMLPATTPQWIWSDEGDPRQGAPAETRYFRHTFTLDPARKVIDKALLEITADNTFTVWLNGAELGSGDHWDQLYRFDVRKLLIPGKNVLAVEAGNADGPAGLVVRLKWTAKGQPEQTLLSDAAWNSSKTREEDWTALGFAEKGWSPVKTLGTYGEVAPWRGVGVNYDLKDDEIADASVALARAYAQQGQTNEAVTTLIAASLWPRTAPPKPRSSQRPRAGRRAGTTGRASGRRWAVPDRAGPTFCRTRQCTAGGRSAAREPAPCWKKSWRRNLRTPCWPGNWPTCC